MALGHAKWGKQHAMRDVNRVYNIRYIYIYVCADVFTHIYIYIYTRLNVNTYVTY